MRKTYVRRNTECKKELKVLASDFGLLHRKEVQEAINNCQSYEEARRKIMKAYELAYMK